jgi:hypothetical protein
MPAGRPRGAEKRVVRGTNETEKYGSAPGSICPDHGRRRATRVRGRLLRKLEPGIAARRDRCRRSDGVPRDRRFQRRESAGPAAGPRRATGTLRGTGPSGLRDDTSSGLPAVQRIALILVGPAGGRAGVQRGVFADEHLPADELRERVKEIVAAAAGRSAVEAEMAALPGATRGLDRIPEAMELRDPAAAAEFVKETGVDALAVCFGKRALARAAKGRGRTERSQKERRVTPAVDHKTTRAVRKNCGFL